MVAERLLDRHFDGYPSEERERAIRSIIDAS